MGITALVSGLVLTAAGLTGAAATEGSPAEPRVPDEKVQAIDREDGLSTVSLAAVEAHGRSAAPRVPAPSDGVERVPTASTSAVATGGARVAALTWDSEEADSPDLTAWIRTRHDGRWGQWHEVPYHDDHEPDPESPEAEQARSGTDPLIIDESDALQVRVDTTTGVKPKDLRIDLINPPAVTQASAAKTHTPDISPLDNGNRKVRYPWIKPRSHWGADESLVGPDLTYGEVNGGFIHHTAGSNSYTSDEVPNIIRGIYVYHVKSRGWNDIGYNFLIDRFGRIWEGRDGGVGRAVQGAHTAGYNDDAFGVAALGTYTKKAVEPRVVSSFLRLFAWKFSHHGVDPRRRVWYGGEIFDAISGHRDAGNTECPGERLYKKIPTIKRGVIHLMYGPFP